MAQVYPRIANPFMPNGTPDKTNSPSPFYAPGELGCSFNDQNAGGSYLRVQLDSGATSATPVGAVAAGQLAFWKDQKNSIVTNDQRMADVGPPGSINRIAGVFQTAVTTAPGVNGTDGNPLMYMCDLVIQKRGYPVLVTGAPSVAGVQMISDTAANNTAKAAPLASASTAPTSQVIGTAASVTVTNNTVPVNVNIGFVD